jgi:hypothetical protein
MGYLISRLVMSRRNPLMGFLVLALLSFCVIMTMDDVAAEPAFYRDPLRIEGPTTNANEWYSQEPKVIPDGLGDIHVFWRVLDKGSTMVHGTLDEKNATLSDVRFLNGDLSSTQQYLAVTSLNDSAFVLAWADDANFETAIWGSLYDVHSRGFTVPVRMHLRPDDARGYLAQPGIAVEEDGTVWIAWIESVEYYGSRLCARAFDQDLNPASEVITINNSESRGFGVGYSLSVHPMADGNVMIATYYETYGDPYGGADAIGIFMVNAQGLARHTDDVWTAWNTPLKHKFIMRSDGQLQLVYAHEKEGDSTRYVYSTTISSDGIVGQISELFIIGDGRIMDVYSKPGQGYVVLYRDQDNPRFYYLAIRGPGEDTFRPHVKLHSLWISNPKFNPASLVIVDGVVISVSTVQLDHYPYKDEFMYLACYDINGSRHRNAGVLAFGDPTRPSFIDGSGIVDPSGTIHAMWVDDRDHFLKVYHGTLSDQGDIVTSTCLETEENVIDMLPKLYLLDDGRIAAFWWRLDINISGVVNYSVVWRVSDDGGLTWTPPREVPRPSGWVYWRDYEVLIEEGRGFFLATAGGYTDDYPDYYGHISVRRMNWNGMVASTWKIDGAELDHYSRLFDQMVALRSGGTIELYFTGHPETTSGPGRLYSASVDISTGDKTDIVTLWPIPRNEYYGIDVTPASDGGRWVVWVQRNETTKRTTHLLLAKFHPSTGVFEGPARLDMGSPDRNLTAFYYPAATVYGDTLSICSFHSTWHYSPLAEIWLGRSELVVMHLNEESALSGVLTSQELMGNLTLTEVDFRRWGYYRKAFGLPGLPNLNRFLTGADGPPHLLVTYPDRPHELHIEVVLFSPNGRPGVPIPRAPDDGSVMTDTVVIMRVHPSSDTDGDPIEYRFIVEWNDGAGEWTSPWMDEPQAPFRWIPEADYRWSVEVRDPFEVVRADWWWVFTTIGGAPIPDPGGPYNGFEGDTIQLDASASWDDSGIVLYEWDLDSDGNPDESSTSPIIEIRWGDDHVGLITLWVTDDSGAVTSAQTTVVIKNIPPEVSVELDGPNLEGEYVQMTATVEDISMEDTFTIIWYIGGEVRGVGTILDWRFGNDGDHSVKVMAIDDDEGVGYWNGTFSIDNAPPLVHGPTEITVGEDEQFTIEPSVKDVPADVLSYEWTMEGSKVGDGEVLDHIIDEPGIHTIDLTVRDGDGGWGSISVVVTVTDVILPVRLKAPEVDVGTVVLKWTEHEEHGFDFYIVRVSTDEDFNEAIEVTILNGKATSTTFEGLEPSKYYYAMVVLHCLNGTASSNVVEFMTLQDDTSIIAGSGFWIAVVAIAVVAVVASYWYIKVRGSMHTEE